MSIETVSSATALPGLTVGVENTSQPTTTGVTAEAFTATLQAQVQRLNATPTPASATSSQNPPMPTVDLKTTPPIANIDSTSTNVTLQATATADTKSAFPELLTTALSTPSNVQGGSATAANPPQITSNVATAVKPAIDPTATVALTPGQMPTVAQPTPQRPTLTVNKSNTSPAPAQPQPLTEMPTQSTAATSTTTDTVTTLSATASASPKKTEKALKPEDMITTPVGIILPQPEVLPPPQTETSPNLIQPQASPETAAAQTPATPAAATQDAVVNTLLQTGVLQPVIANAQKTVTLKAESPTATLPKSLSAATPLPNSPSPLVTSPTLTDTTPSAALSNFMAPSDANAPKAPFATVLDTLKPSDSSAAMDAGLAKTLSNMGSEIAAFDRPSSSPSKMEVPPMSAHLYSPEFSQELGTKIVWMTSQNMSSAELTLNPKHLGPISIHINMQQDQTSVSFTAQNTGVKEMLEASIPKLREMLQTQNLNLADVNVSQQSFSGQNQAQTPSPQFGQNSEGQKRAAAGLENATEPSAQMNEAAEHIEQSRTLVSNGLVSLYA